MLLTLMMNLQMFGESVDVTRQLFEFDSMIDGDIHVNGSDVAFGMSSLSERMINASGTEAQLRFDSKPQLTI